MITVQVKLFASLRQYSPGLGIGERFPLELPDGASIRDLTQQLRLPEDQIKLIFVNGLYQDLEHGLVDGDEVGIFPPVGGG